MISEKNVGGMEMVTIQSLLEKKISYGTLIDEMALLICNGLLTQDDCEMLLSSLLRDERLEAGMAGDLLNVAFTAAELQLQNYDD